MLRLASRGGGLRSPVHGDRSLGSEIGGALCSAEVDENEIWLHLQQRLLLQGPYKAVTSPATDPVAVVNPQNAAALGMNASERVLVATGSGLRVSGGLGSHGIGRSTSSTSKFGKQALQCCHEPATLEGVSTKLEKGCCS